MAGKTIYATLLSIQQAIVAPKDQEGYGYKYRTADGILQAVKPRLKEAGAICTLSDEIVQVGERYYVKATATIIDIATGDSLVATGVANEPNELANMEPPQITGTASTYARKRALEGLFLLDNEKDVDSKEVQDAIQASQNAPQSKQSTYKGKSTNKTQKAESEQADAVRYKAIENLNAQIRRLGLSKDDIVTVATHVVGKASRDDMTDAEICKLTEYLMGEEEPMKKAITSSPQRKGNNNG